MGWGRTCTAAGSWGVCFPTGLLAPLSAPLPSAVFFLASLRRALGIPPSTALAERQSPAALALVVERSSPASAVASFVVIQPLPAGRCAVRCRTAFRRTTTLRAPARSSTATLMHVEVKYGTVTLALPFQSTSARLRAARDAARCPFGANTTRPLINGFWRSKTQQRTRNLNILRPAMEPPYPNCS